jgi:hypothetical protein
VLLFFHDASASDSRSTAIAVLPSTKCAFLCATLNFYLTFAASFDFLVGVVSWAVEQNRVRSTDFVTKPKTVLLIAE